MGTTHNCKKDPNQPQTKTDALAFRKEIQTNDRKQAALVENHPQAHMDLWYITLGLHQTFKHENYTTSSVQNTTTGIQRTMVRKQ